MTIDMYQSLSFLILTTITRSKVSNKILQKICSHEKKMLT